MAAVPGLVGRTPDISSNSKGPIVNLVGWIAMVTTCLSVFTVLISKYLMLRKLTWNDVSACPDDVFQPTAARLVRDVDHPPDLTFSIDARGQPGRRLHR